MDDFTKGKVHAICPDGQHRAILLGLPSDSLSEEKPPEKRSKVLPGAYQAKITTSAAEQHCSLRACVQLMLRSEQLSFKCSLLRRTVERGRLFGGGTAAVEEA